MNKTIYTIGYWSGLFAFLATVAFTIVQALQLIRVLEYPYDEILIYGFSLCIVFPFMIEMLALHHITTPGKKFWSHGALLFTVMYVIFVTSNYVVQLATVIPMTIKGKAGEISILQQTPHSLFWDFDAIGYIFMGFATLFAVPIFEKQGFQKWVRYSLIAHALATPMITFVYFYPTYSEKLLLVGIPWGITAPLFMLLLALFFRKKRQGIEVITK
ncbi:hypothetical protein [Flavihumibacter fluvii]|uniref:hypothetical protein n=1 Tax=Flavihumibacter fluvii TaxID=2838157 RepID=UPI001BDE46A4|nr:hypothetical protein [Flavihumibacter fluvii]ULQ54682.1 hypothetical protein KJS93_10160 [Flavihumibacter fluvii]